MAIYHNPQRINTPQPYQVFRPGQWGTIGRNKGTTINIQNNFYGGFSRWAGDAWANVGNYQQPQTSKFGEIMGWIGLGTSGVGSILNLFGIGKDKSS